MTGLAPRLLSNGELTGIAAVITGTFVCLFGYRLLRVAIAITGLAAGFATGAALATELFHCSIPATIAVAVGTGLAGLLLTLLLFRVGLFILGASAGVLLTHVWQVGTGQPLPVWVYLGIGLATGLLVLLLQRPVVILLTGFGGAGLTIAGVFQLLGHYRLPISFGTGLSATTDGNLPASLGQPDRAHTLLMLAGWILLGVTGCVLQAITGSHKTGPSR